MILLLLLVFCLGAQVTLVIMSLFKNFIFLCASCLIDCEKFSLIEFIMATTHCISSHYCHSQSILCEFLCKNSL